MYCLCTSNPKIAYMYRSVIASLLWPEGYLTVWRAVVFHVHLMWTCEKHISSLACQDATSLFLSLSSPSRHSCVPSGCGKKKGKLRQDKKKYCCFSRQWVWQRVCFFVSEPNLWKLSPVFTPEMMEWINLPRQDHVLTTVSVLSQWDLCNTSPEGFPVARAN